MLVGLKIKVNDYIKIINDIEICEILKLDGTKL